MEPAANYLRAELLPHKTAGWALILHWIKMVVSASFGDTPTTADLVVYRRAGDEPLAGVRHGT